MEQNNVRGMQRMESIVPHHSGLFFFYESGAVAVD
jgi:hypothetical protein